jgi:hypothetical protein
LFYVSAVDHVRRAIDRKFTVVKSVMYVVWIVKLTNSVELSTPREATSCAATR